MAKRDLTNEIFTYLTAIEPAPSRRTKSGRSITRWKCLCKCGKETIVDTNALTSGNTKSCGCLNQEKIHLPKKDITNQRFGKLVVISWQNDGKWLCQCDCGKTSLVGHYNLISGNTKSCGCEQYSGLKNAAEKRIIDLTNKKIGKLLVLYKSDRQYDNGKRESFWHCRCDCGNEVDIALSSLTKEDSTISCGCVKSKGEQKIIEILHSNNITFESQKSFDSCRTEDGNILFFDFYLPEYNCCIEYDGEQHFKSINHFGGEDAFKKRKNRDQLKNNWCLLNNIKILRIPYTDYNKINIQYILERI